MNLNRPTHVSIPVVIYAVLDGPKAYASVY